MSRLDLLRLSDRREPVPHAARELLTSEPDEPAGKPTLLFVGGDRRGAQIFAEHWLAHAAGRGFPAYALSVRGQGKSAGIKGDLRAWASDVAQTAASLPAQPVLIGHSKGARILAEALGRYPARAAVFVAPRLGRLVPPTPAGSPPTLIVGDPDDKRAPRQSLEKAAAHYGVAPLFFQGAGHEMMLAAAWREPLDAILDWLDGTVVKE
ncbi:alpha/beta fold hydrolase [Phytomonospora sp. NPDC050363]|uniref:alpha/beta hydrolase n=1 Tax=Phytomonospora sp. NPDC050363 TaxID=3155642 RepID=UPI0033E0F74F